MVQAAEVTLFAAGARVLLLDLDDFGFVPAAGQCGDPVLSRG